MTEPDFYYLENSGIKFVDEIILNENEDDESFGTVRADSEVNGIYTGDGVNGLSFYWTDISISAPEIEIYTVTVPGRHGIIDMSEALAGKPVFHNRTISATFVFSSDMPCWHLKYSQLLTAIHGKTKKIIIDTDPNYYYEGRCSVSSVRESGVHSSFTITAYVYPYKFATHTSLDKWLWDPFDFEDGIVPDYFGDLEITGEESLSVDLHNISIGIVPVITVSVDCKAEYNGRTYELKSGENDNILLLGNGTERIIFTGSTGTRITICFREAIL